MFLSTAFQLKRVGWGKLKCETLQFYKYEGRVSLFVVLKR